MTADERAGIQTLKEQIDSNPDINCVICWELSRIGRRADVIYEIRDYFISHSVQWIVMTPYMRLLEANGDMSQTSSIMLALFTSLAESEMAIKQERFKRGREYLKAHNKYHNGRVLRGYYVDKNKCFQIDESEGQAPLIRRIFDEYITGKVTVRSLAQEMMDEGFFQNCYNVNSARANIQQIIKERRYYGEEDTHPAIITKETFDKAQEVLKAHKVIVRAPNKAEMLCKGIFFNKKTGYAMMTYSTKKQYTSDYTVGATITVKQDAMDELIWSFSKTKYLEITMNPNVLLDGIKMRMQKALKRHGGEMRHYNSIVESIDKLEERIIRGQSRMSREKADALLEQLDKEKKKSRKEVLNIRASIESMDDEIQALLHNPTNDLNCLDFIEKSDIVHKVIEKIYIDKPKARSMDCIIEIVCKIDGRTYRYDLNSKTKQYQLIEVTDTVQ